MNKEEMQKKILQFQFMESSLKTLQERAQVVAQRMDEVQRTLTALDDLEKTKPEKAFIPIGSGAFVHGSIENTKELLMNVGSGIVLKKKKEEAKKMLEGRIKELEVVMEEITNNAQKIIAELQKIQIEIQKIQQE